MHLRRLASFLLGAWLGAGLLMALVATHNFQGVDWLLGTPVPGVAGIVKSLGHDAARGFLRFQAAELNRWYFEIWGWIQIGLGILVFGILLARRRHARTASVLAGLMLALVVGMDLLLMPEIARLGTALAFVPPDGLPAVREHFRHYHIAYGAAELVKLGLGLALLALLVRRSSRRAPSRGPGSHADGVLA